MTIIYLLVPITSQESRSIRRLAKRAKGLWWKSLGGYEDDQLFWRSFIILKKWYNGCGRTSTADPAPGRSFSSRGYRVAVGQCGSRKFGPSSPGGGGVGQELKVDIVGRWGRVAPMKGKLFDLKKDGGECPELVLSSQVIPNPYWIFLSLEALAKRSCAFGLMIIFESCTTENCEWNSEDWCLRRSTVINRRSHN